MLRLRFTPNQRWHHDLVLELNGSIWPCDSYYFVVDDQTEGQEDAAKVQRGLVRLLRQWLEVVESAAPIDLVYLPYDFSDQYIGCLQCRLEAARAYVTRGHSLMPGHSVLPSDIGRFAREVQDFSTDAIAAVMSRDALCDAIRESIEDIQAHLSD